MKENAFLPKIQVVIPTMAGREKYIYWAIKSCLIQDYPNFEVLISNNGGKDEIRELVEAFSDQRLKYFYTEEFLPMAAHWEFIMLKADGEIITIIGDDDALMPDSLKFVGSFFSKPENTEVECLTQLPAQYYWPDYPDAGRQNRYQCPQGSKKIDYLEPRKVFKAVAEFNDWYGNLPYIYHGFVKRSAVDRVRQLIGKAFFRIYPDVFLDMALALTISKYAKYNCCLTVGGQGAKSTGVNFFTGDKQGLISDRHDYLKPVYYPLNIQIQIFEYLKLTAKLFDYSQPLQFMWFKFLFRAIMEAGGRTFEIFRDSIKELQKIVKEYCPAREKNINFLLGIFNYRLFYWTIKLWVTANDYRNCLKMPSAEKDFQVSDILSLSHRLNAKV